MLILLMLAGLALSSAIPYAFGKNGWLFAAAYCSMQLGRSLYVIWASWGIHDGRARNFARIAFWSLLTLPLWIAGCFADAEVRYTHDSVSTSGRGSSISTGLSDSTSDRILLRLNSGDVLEVMEQVRTEAVGLDVGAVVRDVGVVFAL